MKNNRPLTFIDLFCGAGGMTLGFEKENFKNLFSIDNNPSFCKTYIKNFPSHILLQKSIENLSESEIKNIIGEIDVDVIVGGPPCQGFSIAGNIGRKFINDPRNQLFKEFARIVSIVKPKYFVMENVARLYTHNNGKTKEEINDLFKKINYKVECKILNSADYDVPQIRRRVVFIGSKTNNNIIFPNPTTNAYLTVRDAIKDLPSVSHGINSRIPNHVAMNHTSQMLKKMSYISNGGNRLEIPKKIRPSSGDVRKYIKYNSERPSITITGDMRKVFHYSQNRALTVRELARIQTFPDNFIFEGSSISQQQQVGNAVPPKLAKVIARSIKKMINNEK